MFTTRVWVTYAIVLMSVSWCLYWDVIGHPWSYDDLEYIDAAERKAVVSAGKREPLRVSMHIWFWLTYRIWGAEPAVYHAANICLHALNSFLLAWAVFVWRNDRSTAMICGLLFSISMAHYGAVHWISSIAYLLGVGFGLGAVLFTMHGKMVSAFILFGFAVLSHPSMFLFAMVGWRTWLWQKQWKLICFSLIPLITFFLLKYMLDAVQIDREFYYIGTHALENLCYYAGRAITCAFTAPFGWEYNPPFDVPLAANRWMVYIGLLVIIGGLYGKRTRAGTVLALIGFLPFIFWEARFFSRYFYVAGVGVAIALGSLLRDMPGWFRYVVLILMLIGSNQKITVHNGFSLSTAADWYLSAGKSQDAVIFYQRALKDIASPLAYNNLATAYYRVGDYNNAYRMAEQALELLPGYESPRLMIDHLGHLKEKYGIRAQ